ncbi:MICAL-like protein 2, partial [Protobothrops mucrosquamatus]|uniref:MICAL-like protein 2 n=1 Tax=Protobothrops mucrosquamatus TaxID=103944 RepID=UPI0010FB9A81
VFCPAPGRTLDFLALSKGRQMSKWLPSLGHDRLRRTKSSEAIYFPSAADILFIIPVVEQHMNPGQPKILLLLLLSWGALEESGDFTSLSKENVFENNALAFRVAEKELGIPALLDAEDMVALKVPDRLSILTYVSQYYNYFHGKSPIGGMAGIKRPASQPSEQPTEKRGVPEPRAPSSTQPARPPFLEPKAEPAVVGRRLAMDSPQAVERRVLVEKNNTQPSNCAICGTHVHLVQRLLMDGKLYHRNCFRCKKCSSTLQRGNYQAGLSPGTFVCNRHAGAAPAQLPVSISINSTSDSKKDEARSILQRFLPGPQPSASQPGGVSSAAVPRSLAYNRNLPKDPSHKVEVGAEPQSKVKDGSIATLAHTGRKLDTKVVVKVKNVSGAEEKLENPEDWRAKLKPVKPPHQDAAKPSPKPADVHKVLINIEVKPGQNDKKPPLLVISPAAPNSAPLAVQLPKKKLLVPQLDASISWQKEKLPWESQPATAKAEKWSPSKTVVAAAQPSSPGTFWKHPGDQAVSPTKLHPDYIPEEEIRKEIRQIERDLDKLEQKGITLEKQLRACEGDDSEDALMVEWFKLIHEKQLLLRRESELMHKINQQKLEVKQWDIETELRSLISKADNLKTAKEKAREKELLDSYLDTVNNRNKIVEDLDEDRLRELEEDEMFVDMIKKFGVSRSPQDNEKRKNKFGSFGIWKTKN